MEYDTDVIDYVRTHGLDRLVPFEGQKIAKGVSERVDPNWQAAYPAEWDDLVRLASACRRPAGDDHP